jgi:formylglycine-generating enzyme required for sulfatase activity
MGGTADQGNFVDKDTKPVHYVNLDTYYIGETEVTQELWEAVMSANPSHFKDPKRPVEEVSWDDCQQFIEKLNSLTGRNFRLPTEAEWECAARGCLTGGYMYAGNNNEDFVAWYDRNSYRMYQSDPNYVTHKVKTKSPNRLRIYDMSGNVREWCQDFYGEYSSMDQVNPTGPQSGQTHVIRGGGFTDENYKCKVSYRDREMPEHKSCDLGLRLAL